VRHLAKKLLASQTSSKDLSDASFRTVLIWISCALTFPMYQPAEPAWYMVSGPFMAALANPVFSLIVPGQIAVPSAQKFAINFTNQVLASCGLVVYCMPLRCSFNKHISIQPQIHLWLQRNQQRQQELLEALSDFRYLQFLWSLFAAAEQRVYKLAKGRSQLLGCKLPQVRLEKQWPDRLEAFTGMSVSMLEDAVESLWSCFKSHYLILPAEGVVSYLLDQQLQEGVEGRCATSNREISTKALIAGATRAAVSVYTRELGDLAERAWLQSLARQYKSRFDVGCLWLFHQPVHTTQTLGKSAQELGQAAASSCPTSGKGVPLVPSVAAAAAAAGGGVTCAILDEVEGGYAGVVSITQLRLVVNMLLLLWPQTSSPGAGGYHGPERGAAAAAAESQAGLPFFSLEEQCWDGLLVLAALLQQAPVEAKQQLMKDHGTLLLQLLYHMLLDHEAMGIRGLDTAQVLLTEDNLGEVVREMGGSWEQEDRVCTVSWTAEPMSVVQLVLMVMQSLVFVVDVSGQEDQAGKLLEDGLGIALRGGEIMWM
jgi:hypothetical protein